MPLSKDITEGIKCDSLASEHTIPGKTACVFAHPGRIVVFPFLNWFERKYRSKYRYARLIFALDLFLLGLLAGLAATALFLFAFRADRIQDNIFFEAVVAPREIVSGAPSTLVIRYTNATGEELRDVDLLLSYPRHFSLERISASDGTVDGNAVELGTLAPNDTGTVRVRGVMFGDVGGDQTFRSIMSFRYGEQDFHGQKLSYHAFSPVRSALALTLSLPDTLVAGQAINGEVRYENTGPTDFPDLAIAPEWPEGFTLLETDAELRDGALHVPSIDAGERGTLAFRGRLGAVEGDVAFRFRPSFRFGETTYEQQELTHIAPVIPPQVRVEHSVSDLLRPGSPMEATVQYENAGETAVENVVIRLETDSPFAAGEPPAEAIGRLEPGEQGELALTTRLRARIFHSETETYERIPVRTRAVATFEMTDETRQEVTSRSRTVEKTITSPADLDAFGRFATGAGDQLGRGPLPPRVGETTSYWVFWNLRGTTNPLEQVRLEGALAPGVRFTGRQSASQGGSVREEDGRAVWTAARVEPTFPPAARVLGIAFEVEITPDAAQAGTAPALVRDIGLTARDAVTGAFIRAGGADVTTNLPQDPRAAGKAVVQPVHTP